MNANMKKVIARILKDIQVDMSEEFDKNFERQAFFSEKWQRRKSPIRDEDRAILTDTGALRKSIGSRMTENSIIFYTTLPYAAIHNDGGEIVVTKRMKYYFRYRFYDAAKKAFERKKEQPSSGAKKRRRGELSDGGFYAWTKDLKLTPEAEFWRFMALKKAGSTIKIPRRHFLGRSPEVEKAVREIAEKNLTEYFNSEFDIRIK